MKASMPQPAQRKRRIDSCIVGQATTDEPSTQREVPCYANDTLVLATSGGGTVSVRLATFRPMPCPVFLRSFLGALHHQHQATLASQASAGNVAVNGPATNVTFTACCWRNAHLRRHQHSTGKRPRNTSKTKCVAGERVDEQLRQRSVKAEGSSTLSTALLLRLTKEQQRKRRD
jgi:hypothetical protein